MYYNKTTTNELETHLRRHDVGRFYPDFLATFQIYETNLVCATAAAADPNFNRLGCEQDMQGIMTNGIRQAIGVLRMHMYKMYYLFFAEPNPTDQRTINEYMRSTIMRNLCRDATYTCS
jgi:hypothetical protein